MNVMFATKDFLTQLRCVNDWVKKLLVSSAFWESSEFRRTISVFFFEHGVDEGGVYFIYDKSKILARNCFCINTDRGYSLFKGLYSIYWYCFPSFVKWKHHVDSFWRHILILVLFANCVSEYSHFYDQKFCKNRIIIKIQ